LNLAVTHFIGKNVTVMECLCCTVAEMATAALSFAHHDPPDS
jgi:hypothetical protein